MVHRASDDHSRRHRVLRAKGFRAHGRAVRTRRPRWTPKPAPPTPAISRPLVLTTTSTGASQFSSRTHTQGPYAHQHQRSPNLVNGDCPAINTRSRLILTGTARSSTPGVALSYQRGVAGNTSRDRCKQMRLRLREIQNCRESLRPCLTGRPELLQSPP